MPRAHFPARGKEVLVTVDNIAGLIVAVALLGYLVAALVFPERF